MDASLPLPLEVVIPLLEAEVVVLPAETHPLVADLAEVAAGNLQTVLRKISTRRKADITPTTMTMAVMAVLHHHLPLPMTRMMKMRFKTVAGDG